MLTYVSLYAIIKKKYSRGGIMPKDKEIKLDLTEINKIRLDFAQQQMKRDREHTHQAIHGSPIINSEVDNNPIPTETKATTETGINQQKGDE